MKTYRITKTKAGKQYITEGTLDELIRKHSYTLSASNCKNPKTVQRLVELLQKGADRMASDGFSDVSYSHEEITNA